MTPYGLAAPNAEEVHMRRAVMKNNEAEERKEEDVGINFMLLKVRSSRGRGFPVGSIKRK